MPIMPIRPESVILQLRLDATAHARYSREAASARKPLATYLRELLERRNALEDRLATIEHALEELAAAATTRQAQPAKTPASDQAVILEMLIVLRQLAGPQKADLAQKELKRRGIAPWS